MLKRYFAFIVLTSMFISVNFSSIQANEKSANDLALDYEYVFTNINNKSFLHNYPYHITNFTCHNCDYNKLKNNLNKTKKIAICLTAIYSNNLYWHDIISKINYYREMSRLTNIISEEASIKYYKKFLYLIFKAEESLISGKLKVYNLDEEIYTYRFTAIKILSEQNSNKKSLTKSYTMKEIIEKTKSIKDKLFSDNELIHTKDINNIF